MLGQVSRRFRAELWARPRMVALMGILVVMAAAAVRATVLIGEETSLYVLPAVAFGLMTAVLFDQRIAVLMAVVVGVLTAAGTTDLGLTVYGALATLAPIPFVSAVSSRGSFRTVSIRLTSSGSTFTIALSMNSSPMASSRWRLFITGTSQTICTVVAVGRIPISRTGLLSSVKPLSDDSLIE